jgi:hypothetical protein
MSFVDTGDAGKSVMTQKIDTKLHFGAKKFLAELKDSESVWSLMVDGNESGNLLKSKRICPIFVFALKNLGDPCLVDGRTVSATHSDGTVIISGSSSMLIIFTHFKMHLTHMFCFVL